MSTLVNTVLDFGAANRITNLAQAVASGQPVTLEQMQAATADKLTTADIFSDFVVSGLLSPTSASLSSTLAAGTAYVIGTRVVVPATTYTYAASSDTYDDLSSAGMLTHVAVANGAAAPAVTANSLRLQKVVTSATAVTAVTRLAAVNSTAKFSNLTVGNSITLGSNSLAISQFGYSVSVPQFYCVGVAAFNAPVDGLIGLNIAARTASSVGLVVSAASAATADIAQVYGSGSSLKFNVAANGNVGIGRPTPAYRLDVNGSFAATSGVFTGPVRLPGYTVATLPAGTQGDKAYVTDALAPTYLVTVVGGGTVVTEVFFNGTSWICT